MIDEFKGQFRFLSNFYPSPLMYCTEKYATVEHAYQAAKAYPNFEVMKEIQNVPTPGKAKRAGQKAKLRNDWESLKEGVMYQCVYYKFNKNEYLKQCLVLTEGHELVEGNYWHDNYWGNCFCNKCQDIKGKNRLGVILMNVRKELLNAPKDND